MEGEVGAAGHAIPPKDDGASRSSFIAEAAAFGASLVKSTLPPMRVADFPFVKNGSYAGGNFTPVASV